MDNKGILSKGIDYEIEKEPNGNKEGKHVTPAVLDVKAINKTKWKGLRNRKNSKFCCTECDAGFTKKQELIYHTTKVHKIYVLRV